MKIHYRIINRDPKAKAQFSIACGNHHAKWTRDTTPDQTRVTCERCRKIAKLDIEKLAYTKP